MTQVLSAAAIILATLPVQAQTTGKVLSDQILPSDTYFYMSFPNMTAMKDHMVSSSMGQMWNDPALDQFKTQVYAAFDEQMQQGMQEVSDTIGMSLQELMEIPNGEVTMAIAGAPGNAMGAIIYLDFGDKLTQVQSLMDKN